MFLLKAAGRCKQRWRWPPGRLSRGPPGPRRTNKEAALTRRFTRSSSINKLLGHSASSLWLFCNPALLQYESHANLPITPWASHTE
jgi:hypothetical protein